MAHHLTIETLFMNAALDALRHLLQVTLFNPSENVVSGLIVWVFCFFCISMSLCL